MLLGIVPESREKELGRTERGKAVSCFVHLQNSLDSAWSLALPLFIWVETQWDYSLVFWDGLSQSLGFEKQYCDLQTISGVTLQLFSFATCNLLCCYWKL